MNRQAHSALPVAEDRAGRGVVFQKGLSRAAEEGHHFAAGAQHGEQFEHFKESSAASAASAAGSGGGGGGGFGALGGVAEEGEEDGIVHERAGVKRWHDELGFGDFWLREVGRRRNK